MALTDAVIAFLRSHGTLDISGLTALAAVFVVTGLIPVPRTALCLASGTIFGLAAISRHFAEHGRSAVSSGFCWRVICSPSASTGSWTGSRRCGPFLAAVDSEGWRIVGLMRFAGAMPTFFPELSVWADTHRVRPIHDCHGFVLNPQNMPLRLYWRAGACGRCSTKRAHLGAGARCCRGAVPADRRV